MEICTTTYLVINLVCYTYNMLGLYTCILGYVGEKVLVQF